MPGTYQEDAETKPSRAHNNPRIEADHLVPNKSQQRACGAIESQFIGFMQLGPSDVRSQFLCFPPPASVRKSVVRKEVANNLMSAGQLQRSALLSGMSAVSRGHTRDSDPCQEHAHGELVSP
jgi:hypothetical protein